MEGSYGPRAEYVGYDWSNTGVATLLLYTFLTLFCYSTRTLKLFVHQTKCYVFVLVHVKLSGTRF
jgi:hypothetical protein